MGVALVTGGSRGIGRAIAIKLSENGYNIGICYAGNKAMAEETVNICKSNNVNAIAVKADISKADEVEGLFIEIENELGDVDLLVNNAGVTKDGLLLKMSETDFDDVLDINLKGTFLCTKRAIKKMIKAKKGNIINISSIVGVGGNAGQANYAASKAGIIGFTKSIAKEYGSRNIRCNAVAPGFISTEMTQCLPDDIKIKYLDSISLRRFGSVDDVANCVEYMASDKSGYITGQILMVDGGM